MAARNEQVGASNGASKTPASQKELHASPSYPTHPDHNVGNLSNQLGGIPSLESWKFECILAHRQIDDQTEYLAKPRPQWLGRAEIPPEAEAEYWHRYHLDGYFRPNPGQEILPGPLEMPKSDKEDKQPNKPPHSIGFFERFGSALVPGSEPSVRSIVEIMNQSRPQSPV